MDTNEHDAILRALVRIATNQDSINQDIRTMLGNHDAMLRNHDALLLRLELLLQAIRDILGRDNGR